MAADATSETLKRITNPEILELQEAWILLKALKAHSRLDPPPGPRPAVIERFMGSPVRAAASPPEASALGQPAPARR